MKNCVQTYTIKATTELISDAHIQGDTIATATKSSPKTTARAAAPAARAPAKRSAAAPAKAPRVAKASAASEPSLRFYHSQALRQKTDAVLTALETHPGKKNHGEAIADLVSELIDAGMDYYFLKALKTADVGFVAEQSARLGMSGAVKLISSVSSKFITRMDHPQLLVVATHIRSLATD